MYPLLNKLKYFGIFDLHFNIFYILIKLYFLNKKTLTSFLIQDNVLYCPKTYYYYFRLPKSKKLSNPSYFLKMKLNAARQKEKKDLKSPIILHPDVLEGL